MMENIRENKGITLIALVITIVILIILAAVAINTVLGENGILARAKQAALEHKKAQYYEEINIEILEEQMERQTSPSDTPFIVSLNERLAGTEQASNESVTTHSRKSWVKSTIMCDNHFNKNENDLSKNTTLIIETTDNYEIYIHVNNETCTATIDENSFEEVQEPCVVHFNSNEGTGTVSDINIRKNFTVTLPENSFTRTNYSFGGWCLNSNGTGTIYTENSASDPITEDTTFYAVWTLDSVTLSYDSNGGTGTMNSVPVIINTSTRISENAFERQGYIFDKWTTNQDGSGDSYSDLDDITIDEDTTLYAQWIRRYTLQSQIVENGGNYLIVSVSIVDNDEANEIVSYEFYINNSLSYTGTNNSFTFLDLRKNTDYTIKIIGKDSNNVLKGITESVIKTSNTVNSRYLVFEIYDHIGSNGNTINEIEIYNSSNTKCSYSIPYVYDSANNGNPNYWTSTLWDKSKLYDGSISYTSNEDGRNHCTIFAYPSDPNTNSFARFVVDLGSSISISNIRIAIGNNENRTPKSVSVYTIRTSDYVSGTGANTTYTTNITSRNNNKLSLVYTRSYTEQIVTPTWYSFI